MNYANKPSQAALERASQDVIASPQGGCVDSRRRGAFDGMNIQNVSTSRLYSPSYSRLDNRPQSVYAL